jgi:hypothetical protein
MKSNCTAPSLSSSNRDLGRVYVFLVLFWLLSFVASLQLAGGVERWGFAAISRHGSVYIRLTMEIHSTYPEFQAYPLAN